MTLSLLFRGKTVNILNAYYLNKFDGSFVSLLNDRSAVKLVNNFFTTLATGCEFIESYYWMCGH